MEEQAVEIKRGLEGVIFTETYLSAINGEAGKLSYCGHDIKDLAAEASYEETAFLLWYQRLPAEAELEMLSDWLRANRRLPKVVWGIMHSLPEQATPMEVLRTATAALSMFDPTADAIQSFESNLEKALRLTAVFPTILAAFDRAVIGFTADGTRNQRGNLVEGKLEIALSPTHPKLDPGE